MHIRNVPAQGKPKYMIRIKPIPVLLAFIGIGFLLLLGENNFRIAGICLLLGGFFPLLAMPDWLLINAHDEFMVLFNQRDRRMCAVIYYDDIKEWSYERRYPADRFVLTLNDGTSQMIEMYARRPVVKIMEKYCPGKESRR